MNIYLKWWGRLDALRTIDWAKLKENLLNMSINRVMHSPGGRITR